MLFRPPPKKSGSICCIKKKKRRKNNNNSILARLVLLRRRPGPPLCFVTCNVLSFSPCRVASSAHQDFAIPFFKRKPAAEGMRLSCTLLTRQPSGHGPRTATGQPRFSAGLQNPNLFRSGAVKELGGKRCDVQAARWSIASRRASLGKSQRASRGLGEHFGPISSSPDKDDWRLGSHFSCGHTCLCNAARLRCFCSSGKAGKYTRVKGEELLSRKLCPPARWGLAPARCTSFLSSKRRLVAMSEQCPSSSLAWAPIPRNLPEL